MLADILSRDGAEQSASVTRQRNLANADHLATLHAIWAAETQTARHDRYRDLVMAALPPGRRQSALAPGPLAVPRPCTPPSWPGLDPGRGHPHRHRIPGSGRIPRHRRRPRCPHPPAHRPAAPAVPGPLDQPGAPAARPSPVTPTWPGSPRSIDDRTRRLGQYAAQTTPSWAASALGPVPGASPLVGSGKTRPPRSPRTGRCTATTIPMTRSVPSLPGKHRISGPRGTRLSPPSARQASRTSGPCPTGSCGWPATPTRRRPPGRPRMRGRSCGLSRLGAFDAALAAIRADAETAAARKAGVMAAPRGTRPWPPATGPSATHYQQREHDLTQDMAARQEWEHATERSRRLAIAADAELRRRHPGRKIEPLRSAEPVPASATGCDPVHAAVDGKLTDPVALIRDLAVQREQFRAVMDERLGLIVPGDHGKAFRAMKTPRPGCDPAAAQAGDHPLGQDPPARRRARHRTRGWRLTHS